MHVGYTPEQVTTHALMLYDPAYICFILDTHSFEITGSDSGIHAT